MNLNTCDIEELLQKARMYTIVDRDKIPHFQQEANEILDKFKECIVLSIVGKELEDAQKWLKRVLEVADELKHKLDLAGFTFPREFSSFITDPLEHLKKKLFHYTHDLIRGRISLEDFLRKAPAAVRTSLRTNMRSAYQIWCLITIMSILVDRGYTLIYPEHKFLNLDRSGKQKLGIIPPNAIMLNLSKGYVSIFHEAPRPLSWEDTSDLQKVWSLYTALRPDTMIYGGKVTNIVDLTSSPPIKRPNIILEFKELEDWYTRVRDLRGYFKKPLTAEEWKSMWLEGLYGGLADILGVKRSEVRRRIEEGASLRVREYQLVKLYYSTYKPDKMILVSRKPVPTNIKEDLEASNIHVLDNVEFDHRKLNEVVDEIERYASFEGGYTMNISVSFEVAKLIDQAMRELGFSSIDSLLKEAIKTLMKLRSRDDGKHEESLDAAAGI